MTYYPTFQELISKYPQTKRDLDFIVQTLFKLEANSRNKSNENIEIDIEAIKNALESSGASPLNVQSLLGKLAEPQIPYIPTGASVPSNSDPQSQDGALFRLSTTNVLYRFDASSEPGSWVALSGGTVTSVGLSLPIGFSVTGSPVTGSGTLAVTSKDSINITTVTANANSTSDQNLMSYDIPANALNAGSRTIKISIKGIYTTRAGQTPTITFKLKLDGATIITFVSNTTTAAATDIPFEIEVYIICSSAGATGAAVAKGHLHFDDNATAGGNAKTHLDTNNVPLTSIDFTQVLTLQVTAQFSTQPATPFNSISQQLMIVEYIGN